ncbi:disease resistance protein RPM1 [Morus notabilis]|uniref:disease resistance protein RPM1 n=1 Tax=Morus notabilis TaxID=981085 RepID=UPI000CED2FC2|nr:disease resistance protein RPM1 [Morus notabilis]
MLIEGASTRLIISLVGEGGIGKTTLAKNVHNDEVVKRHFELASAWITVSQPYNLTKVLMEMKRQLCKSGADCLVEENNAIEQLIECVRTYLQTKRYVIFLDDVWDENFWDDTKLALPNNNEGSRIIVTTRNAAVADSCRETPYDVVQNLNPWSQTLAWELFCKKAFKYEFQGNCPQELVQLSIEIVRRCQGLPLVIATIASLLSTKEKVESEWRKVLDDLNSKVEINSQFSRIQKILSLSYYDLPYSLRSCFLCFGIFPEDYSISDERLFRLWIAEGFIKAKVGKTLEEVAEEYLSELTKRSLVACDQLKIIGLGNGFRVHDLMRDVILSLAYDVCFCHTWDKKRSKSRVRDRRLIISGSTKDVLDNVESSVVLEVENAPVDTLPKELGKLFCLKYLSLRNTRVKVLPKSINKLHNLESLDIRDSLIRKLPKAINELANLRHLLAYRHNHRAQNIFYFDRGVTIEEGFGRLDVLQTLTLVEADIGGASLMKELEKLTNLRWLGISKLTKEIWRALCASIGKMNHLKRLFLSSINESDVLDIYNTFHLHLISCTNSYSSDG